MHSNCGDADGAQTLSIKRRGGRLRECLGQVRHVGAGAPTRKQAIVGKSPVATMLSRKLFENVNSLFANESDGDKTTRA